MKKILDLAMQKAKASFDKRTEEGSETSPFMRLNAGHDPPSFYRASVVNDMNALYQTLHNTWSSIPIEQTEQKKGSFIIMTYSCHQRKNTLISSRRHESKETSCREGTARTVP